jgi:hypothetical protein
MSPADPKSPPEDPWLDIEEARRRQLRADALRSLSVNLAEGLALSEFLSTFTGAARRTASQDPGEDRD